MTFEKLTEREKKVVLQVMQLVLIEEHYIGDWEFETRLGITREDLRQVIAQWPHLDDTCDEENSFLVSQAIHSSFNEVVNGIRVTEADWAKWIHEPEEEVERVYQKWEMYKAEERGDSA